MNIANISTWRKFCNCHFIFEYVSDFIIKQGIKYISCFIIFVDLIIDICCILLYNINKKDEFQLNLINFKNPYKFDLDKNGLPIFSKKNTLFMQAIIDNDSNYSNDREESFSKQFSYFPKDLDELEKAIKLIDKENSTHIYVNGWFDKLKSYLDEYGIENLGNDVESGNQEIVNTISTIGGSNHFSFATKFCAYCNRSCFQKDDYSIYDSVLEEILPYYAFVYLGKKDEKGEKLWYINKNSKESSRVRKLYYNKYKDYHKLIGDIIESAKIINDNQDLTRKDFDNILWYYYKGRNDRQIKAKECLEKNECILFKEN